MRGREILRRENESEGEGGGEIEESEGGTKKH